MIQFDFSGQRVLVVGGTSGINRGIARAFAEQGAHVAVVSRSEEKCRIPWRSYLSLAVKWPVLPPTCATTSLWRRGQRAGAGLGCIARSGVRRGGEFPGPRCQHVAQRVCPS